MPARLRPARIDDVVDGVKLRTQLTAVALDKIGDEAATRAGAQELLHRALFRGRMIAKERLENGAGGLETARLLAQVADQVIAALYDFTITHVFRARNPTAGERFAVLAVGGYGRSQLAPSSDIDLLFLRAYKQTPWAESVTEYMLYMLWDMGLKVGYASRTIDETIRLSRQDHTIHTALLESRRLVGDESLANELSARFAAEVVAPGHRAFIAAKLRERDERNTRSGASRYMVEPNVKEGKGGLRDLHTLFWILKDQYGKDNPIEFARLGVFTREEVAAFVRAAEFLWKVRCHLHFLTGRAEERISFDLQPEMAIRLGYGPRGEQPAVERFMKHYFLVAKEVGALTRILCAKLEAEQQKRAPASMSRFLRAPMARAQPLAEGFKLESGRLTVESAKIFDRDPVNLLRLFEIAEDRDLDIHPEALAEVTRRLKRITPAVRRNPEAARVFLEVAASRNNPGAALRLMNEAGVLGRFVPEFGRIVAQMQFNMYHHYTVDEHTLRAIEVISSIEKGVFGDDHPLSTQIFSKIVNRRALYLAMLLHDTGKGVGDQQVEGEKSARAACERLGLPEEEVDLVGWLVRNHLAFSDFAQKRDVSDPMTVAALAQLVGDLERLRLLLVLTVADIRAVGPGVWNGWKGQLMRDLYAATEAVLRGGRTDEAGVRARLSSDAAELREKLVAKFPAAREPALAAWLDTLDDAYWLSADPEAAEWHMQEAQHALASDEAHVAAQPRPRRGVTELLVYAADRPGLFSRLAAALTLSGADVSDARVHTTSAGRAFDIFSIQDVTGRPFGEEDPTQIERLIDSVRAAASSERLSAIPPRTLSASHKRAAAFKIEPRVRLDDNVSSTATVIEVSGRDRPGVLADLTRVLAQDRVSIVSAHIDAYGERVADVFYVQEVGGAKLAGEARKQALKTKLENVLREGGPGAPAAANQRLAVAPASSAR